MEGKDLKVIKVQLVQLAQMVDPACLVLSGLQVHLVNKDKLANLVNLAYKEIPVLKEREDKSVHLVQSVSKVNPGKLVRVVKKVIKVIVELPVYQAHLGLMVKWVLRVLQARLDQEETLVLKV